MKEQEKLITQVFDKSVEALGLMAKKLSDAIESNKVDKRYYTTCIAMQSMLANPATIVDNEKLVTIAFEIADEMLKQEQAYLKLKKQ